MEGLKKLVQFSVRNGIGKGIIPELENFLIIIKLIAPKFFCAANTN